MSWSCYGGNIAEFRKPFKRKYGPKSRLKRPVTVKAYKYYGLGRHYWVSLHEEDNPIWDAEKKGWRLCWDDAEGRGRIFSKSFLSMTSARLWIEKLVQKEFPKEHFKLDKSDLNGLSDDDEKIWFGHYKEGD